jgi:hypothetical protein
MAPIRSKLLENLEEKRRIGGCPRWRMKYISPSNDNNRKWTRGTHVHTCRKETCALWIECARS